MVCDLNENLDLPFQQYNKIDHVIHTATNYGINNEFNSQLIEKNLLFPLKLFELATFFNTDYFFNTNTILYNILMVMLYQKNSFVNGLSYLQIKPK